MPSERTVLSLTGLISIVFFAAVSVFAIEAGAGKLSPKYHLSATFDQAGQGLIQNSDVKVHGVNVGMVTSVRLVRGRALVRMALHTDQKVPMNASATIRAKTLFGEKFVDIDPGPDEATGPFLHNHGVIEHTTGGFELERVLSDLEPILKAVNPDELAVLLDTLARGGEGTGPEVNRQIVNFQKVADVNAKHAADTQRFLDDLSKLTGMLADRSPDLVAAARDLNVALPDLNARGDELSTLLDQTSRLSGDLADVLDANRPFLDKNVTEGGKVLQILSDNRAQIPGVVRGLNEFFQTLSEVATHIPDPSNPGTYLAAVEFIAGGGPPCGRPPAVCASSGPGAAASRAGGPRSGGAGHAGLPPVVVPPLAVPVPGVDGILRLLTGVTP
jgi:phospholipid/cholesterol/gamma-HCH transport system substrate-binding protein